MDQRFSPHNLHWQNLQIFEQNDPQLRRLRSMRYVYESSIVQRIPTDIPGVYIIHGGRQIGKTTLLKQWMVKLLKSQVAPSDIAYFSGELIDDHHSLLRLIQEYLDQGSSGRWRYLILDEVTYIRDWDKAIKYAADAGLFDQVVVVLTGSDLAVMREARVRFPGRRGTSKVTDFHYYPLSFHEVVNLINPTISKGNEFSQEEIKCLFEIFQNYLIHGGFLVAINDLAVHNRIQESTLRTYSDWIRGDILRQGKQEHYFREIVGAIIKRYGSQISWNALAKDLSIDHHKTVADYILLMESMDAVFIQSAIIEDKLVAAPKKARKVMFADPFIFHALRAWIDPLTDSFENGIQPFLQNSEWVSKLVESCVVTHYRRFFPTFYIKAEGEVDVAYIEKGRMWPIEVKWSHQLRSKDLKQIAKYTNGKILTQSQQNSQIHGIPTVPLPWDLWQLEESNRVVSVSKD